MLRCMYSGISGMKVNQTKLDIIGNNIANVGTTAFKASSAKFSDMIYQSSGSATSATSTKGGTNAKQVGLGAKLSSIDKLMSQGNALNTGRSLDVCVDGEGYIVVGTGVLDYGTTGGNTLNDAQGISGGNMSISYTRDGNFKLDSEGNLLTADGYRVMGYLLTATNQDGTPTTPASAASSLNDKGEAEFVDANGRIKAADDAKLQPLRIPDSVFVPAYTDAKGNAIPESNQKVASFSIGKDGVIEAVLANGSRTALGQIATATFKNPEGLTSLGGNLYQTSSNSGAEIIRTAVNIDVNADGSAKGDTKDNSKAFGDLIQGALEASNVDLTEQFTEMITATRSFQASSKMITTGDEILQTVTGLMR